jgi:hypothetical protein
MATRRTWLAKIRRAETHLAEFNDAFETLRRTEQPYDVTFAVEHFPNGDHLVVHGHLTPFGDDDDLAAVVGDIVANARDALDHIYTALTGRRDAHFPVYKTDIFQPDIDPSTGQDRNLKVRNLLTKDGTKMPSGALGIITAAQPYHAQSGFEELSNLAILQRLSNADKCRGAHGTSRLTLIEIRGRS